MKITEVTVKLMPPDPKNPRMLAYASIILDDELIIPQLKIIKNKIGRIMVCFPDMKFKMNCQQCLKKIPVDSIYCLNCGDEIPRIEVEHSIRHYKDVVHPITNTFRLYIEKEVLHEFINVSSK